MNIKNELIRAGGNFLLLILATGCKILLRGIAGLLFTNNVVELTDYLSRSANVSVLFIGFLAINTIIDVILFASLCKFYGRLPHVSLGGFFRLLVLLVVFNSLLDFAFSVEVKFTLIVGHLSTLVVFGCKYLIILLFSLFWVVGLYGVNKDKFKKIFFDYEYFIFRKIIPEKVFLKANEIIGNKVLFTFGFMVYLVLIEVLSMAAYKPYMIILLLPLLIVFIFLAAFSLHYIIAFKNKYSTFIAQKSP